MDTISIFLPNDLVNIINEYDHCKNYDSVIDEMNSKITKAVELMYDRDYNIILWGSCPDYDSKKYNDYLNHIFICDYRDFMPSNHIPNSDYRSYMTVKFFRALLL